MQLIMLGALISSLCYSMNGLYLPKKVYQIRAQKFLEVQKLAEKKYFDRGILKQFLRDRIKNANNALIGSSAHKKLELHWLNSGVIFLYAVNIVETDYHSRVAYKYATMAEENLVFELRKKIGCYATELEHFEKMYQPPLQKIEIADFDKRISEIFPENKIHEILFESSKTFAQTILEETNRIQFDEIQ